MKLAEKIAAWPAEVSSVLALRAPQHESMYKVIVHVEIKIFWLHAPLSIFH